VKLLTVFEGMTLYVYLTRCCKQPEVRDLADVAHQFNITRIWQGSGWFVWAAH
jgi:hypothetical protein